MAYRPEENKEGLNVWSIYEDCLSTQQQFEILNSLPNFHKWPWKGTAKRTSFEERLPTATKVYPGSPRHRTIQAICARDEPAAIIHAILKNINGTNVPVPYKRKHENERRLVRL